MDNPNGSGEHVDPGTGEVMMAAGGVPAAVGNVPKDITDGMPLALRIYFDNDLYNRTKQVAHLMANARGFTPQHLINKGEACFAITTLSLRTGIDPFFLAQNTYQTPNGQVGYMTRAVQAIIDQSGVLTRVPQREYHGDWDKLTGMFQIKKSSKDKDYAVPTWGRKEAEGLSLTITLHFKDQDQPETFTMSLTQAFPLFSTMWATDPKTQFFNLVCRRAINTLRPGALAGVRHQDDLMTEEAHPGMKDITPKPEKSGDAGLDDFASSGDPSETVVEDEPAAEPAKATKPANHKKAEPKTKAGESEKIMIWVSENEPARELKSVSNAVFVIRNLIKEARSSDVAQAIFDRNIDVIGRAGKEAGDSLEVELKSRLAKDGPSDGADGDSPAASETKTVWLGPDDPEHPFTGEGNAIHLMRTGIREAKTAAAAKTIIDQNAELIGGMPTRIAEELDFEVAKRFEQGKGGKKLL